MTPTQPVRQPERYLWLLAFVLLLLLAAWVVASARAPLSATGRVKIITDELNVITVALLVLFFVIKVSLFAHMWMWVQRVATEMQQDIRNISVGSAMVANQMTDVRERVLETEAKLIHIEARLDAHLLNCDGVDETSK